MECRKENMLLYAVTDRAWTGCQSLLEQVECALKGGATCVQLREKELDESAFLEEAIQMKQLCARYGVPFIVNDNAGEYPVLRPGVQPCQQLHDPCLL